MPADLRSLDTRCYGTGELECHCGGDLCVCGLDTLPCPGCPDCADQDDDQTDAFDEADRECGKIKKGQCNRAGDTYCQFHCPYKWDT